jgi:glycosyltransferase involved in cell wall biosynthesis
MPGALETPTGGYVYNRRMIDGLVGQGWSVGVRMLDPSFPHPTPAALAHAADVLAAIPAGASVVVDGLALGAMPDLIEREAARLRIAALVHLPLAADVTRSRESAAQIASSERRALRAAALVIVTGRASLSLLAAYQILPENIVIVEPGTARVPISRCTRGASVMLLSVATLHPGKGHEILLDALVPLTRFDWHLVCAGSLTRHPETAARVRTAAARLGLDERVSLVGALDAIELSRCYDRADVFVLATLQETYGMAVAEALAHGLPIVATATGAIPEMVGEEAGLLVPPGDSAALSDALSRVIVDAVLRARLAAGAGSARNRLPTWDQASRRMASALERLVAHR